MAPAADTRQGGEPEPIAIIGMSCRFPGGANEPARLWDALAEAKSAWSEVPSERFNMKAFHHKQNPHASTTNTAGGHFLDGDVAAFDCSFFEIKATEAQALDPQQRMTLELAYEAFENAGQTLPQLWGSATGVYVGQWSSDYGEVLSRDTESHELYHTLGIGAAITSNRVSYFFNLRGPSFTVDTGCSASLVALHNAVQSLRAGESDMSLVGGVNVLLDPQRFTYQSKLKMFSPDGRSFSFDSRANGYGRGEGCGCVVLKPLSRAVRDGDRIRAVIRNSALNQDGRTPQGISVPSMDAQEELIRRAYAEVGLDPLETDYVEAHGTGTAVGDPIEANAIAKVLGVPRAAEQGPLRLGSVKGNIGHTESAAGIAGVIKSVLMLENQAVAPQVNYLTPNPKIPLDEWNLMIPTAFEKKDLRRISVNSFGYGGTNAHVILERASEAKAIAAGMTNGVNGHATNGVNGHATNGVNGHTTNGVNGHAAEDTNGASSDDFEPAADRPRVFLLSAGEEQGCYRNAQRLAQYLTARQDSGAADADADENPGDFLDRLAVTVNKRTVHDYSAAVVAYDEEDLQTQLEVLQQTPVPVRAPFKGGARVGFVFGGQGAQYHNMGREMLAEWPVFRASLDRAGEVLKKLGAEWDLVAELSHDKAGDSRVDEPEYGQTLSTAVQLALVDTLAALGLRPASVVGHSSGEIASGYAVGALSFEDAVTVSYHRGRLTSKLIAGGVSGAMMAVGAAPEVAEAYIAKAQAAGTMPAGSEVKIACYNSPASVTLSGDNAAIAEVERLLQEGDVFNRKLKTQGAAYHSRMMRAMEDEYRAAIAHIKPRPLEEGGVTMSSSLSGKALPAGTLLDGDYWARNLISPVLFAGALKAMVADSEDTAKGPALDVLLEVGPHAQMQGAVKETLQSLGSAARGVAYVSCLKRKTSAAESMLRALADLFVYNAPVDLHRANAGFSTKPLPAILDDAPPYAFNHDARHWHESRIAREFTHRQFLPHELLGNLSPDVNHTEPKWRRFLRLKELPWLQNHIVQGQVVFPAAGYLAMALEAMRRFTAFKGADESNGATADKAVLGYSFSNCSFSKALVLREGDSETEICLSLRPEAQSANRSWQDWKEFRVFSTLGGKGWSEHCRGRIRAVVDESVLADRLADVLDVKERSLAVVPHHVTPSRFYTTARQVGMEWYAPFDNMTQLQGRTDSSVTVNTMPSLDNPAAHPFGGSDYVVHPGMLDSTLFHGICASLLVEREVKAPVVPVFIEQLHVATAALPELAAGQQLRTYALAQDEGTCWSAQIEVGEGGKTVMSAHGMRTTQLPGNMDTSLGRQLAHSPEWVAHWPSMTRDEVVSRCAAVLPAGSSRQRNVALNASVRDGVSKALQTIKADEVAPGFQQLWYQWMQNLVASPADSAEEVAAAREAMVDDPSVAFKAVRLVGEHAVELLKGEMTSLSLFSEDDLLGKMYQEERNDRCYLQINEYCRNLGLFNPALKMLEVGGGTASATLPLLQALTHRGGAQSLVGQYDFTDLSTAFFPAAKERLAQFGHLVNYEAFDLSVAPDAQGFEAGTYDVVVACNVVHATPNIADSLNNIRALLKPGGTMVLMEITRPEPFYQLVFGSLSGWWLGAEEGRVNSAILSNETWKDLLVKQGYMPDPLILADYDQSEGGTISVIFAQTPAVAAPAVEGDSSEVKSDVTLQLSGASLAKVAEHLGQQKDLGVGRITVDEPASDEELANTVLVVDVEHCEALAALPGQDATGWTAFQKRALSCKAMVLVTRGAYGETAAQRPDGALAVGFARTMRLEQPSRRYVVLDLDASAERDDARLAGLLAQLLRSETFDLSKTISDVDYEFAERDGGKLRVNRLFLADGLEQSIVRSTARAKVEQTEFLQRDRPLRAELGVAGLLETFRWVDDDENARPLQADEVRLESRAASINFRDVLIATGELGGSATMMNDCAGTVVEVGSAMRERYSVGDRVTSYYAQSYNNYPIVHGDHCARVPDSVSFGLAASLPIVWATTYHALVNVARVRKGESVLVHAAAGAVGQAAVILARHLGAVVYATCGSPEKRALLEGLGVDPSHIFTSRSAAFGPALRSKTANRGVDVVLNSLAGELFRESLSCLASFGRFVEIGKKDFLDDALMPTKFLLRNITFACVDLVQMINEDKPFVHKLLNDVVALVASGELKDQVTLLPYKLGEIEAAFRLISAGKHMGKVIMTVDPGETVPALPEPPRPKKLASDATYILVGGFGGLGVRLIRWLGLRGAKTIVTLSRSGAKAPTAQACIAEMADQGVRVVARSCDISSKSAVDEAVREAAQLGSIKGVINAAMALEDALFDQMTYAQWQASLAPKVAGTLNLHEALADAKDLDLFVVLSSIAGVSGHVAQANYTAACAFQDALMRHRRAQGLAGFAIDVGVVGDAGFVSETPSVFANMKREGFSAISVVELLATLDYVLVSEAAAATDGGKGEAQASLGLVPEAGVNLADWLTQRRIAHLVNSDASGGAGGAGGGDGNDAHLEAIRRSKTAEEALEAVSGAVLAELSKLTVTPVDRILPHRTLDSYGVDSLVAVELRNWIVAMLMADVSLLLIRESRSIEDLVRLVASKSRLVPAKLQEGVSKLA